MPPKFSTSEPQRVCDVCGVRLECIQPYLMNKISRACQIPTNDLTDLSTLRSWLNLPWARTMEYEIYKAVNSIYGYFKVWPSYNSNTCPCYNLVALHSSNFCLELCILMYIAPKCMLSCLFAF